MLVRTKIFAVCFFLLSLGTQIVAQERVKLAEARVRHSDQQDAQMADGCSTLTRRAAMSTPSSTTFPELPELA